MGRKELNVNTNYLVAPFTIQICLFSPFLKRSGHVDFSVRLPFANNLLC